MAYEPVLGRKAASKDAPRRGSISSMLFLAGMGSAFWIGTLWASKAWLGW